jgi:hypothetical protein
MEKISKEAQYNLAELIKGQKGPNSNLKLADTLTVTESE